MNKTACYFCNRCRTGTGIAGVILTVSGATLAFTFPDMGHGIIAVGHVLAGLALVWLGD